jgi:hypothetical protein
MAKQVGKIFLLAAGKRIRNRAEREISRRPGFHKLPQLKSQAAAWTQDSVNFIKSILRFVQVEDPDHFSHKQRVDTTVCSGFKAP